MIITLTGSNAFLLQAELRRLKADFIAQHGDLAYEQLDGEEASFERIQEALTSLPFLATKKLVILRNPSAQKQFADNIEQLIKNLPETTDLVILESKIDKRSAYFKVLKANTEFKEFNQQTVNDLNNWIVQYTKAAGGNIALSQAAYLVERAGNDQQLLANEIDKLLNFDPNITKLTIDELTEPSPQSTIFELLDAAFAGNNQRIMQLYSQQRALKVEPQQIIAMLAWQLHILAVVKLAGRQTASDIAKAAKLNPFVVRKTASLASKIDLVQVKNLVRRALALDIKLKTKTVDASEALQHFLLTISF